MGGAEVSGWAGYGDAEGCPDSDGYHERQYRDEYGDRPVWGGCGECADRLAGIEGYASLQKGDEAGDRADACGSAEVWAGEDDAAGDGRGDGADWHGQAGQAGRDGTDRRYPHL